MTTYFINECMHILLIHICVYILLNCKQLIIFLLFQIIHLYDIIPHVIYDYKNY